MRVFLLTVIFMLINGVNPFFSATLTSTGSGDWATPGTWSPAAPPACGDTVIIKAGDIVTITSHQDYSEPGCMSPMFIIINGTLDFPVNGPKLRLPCNSGVIINTGGSLTASGGAGGGSANFLEICGTVVWKKADGPQFGPLIFGNPLPVELLSFEVHVNEDKIDLKWVTATEINNDYFTVERSQDGKNWSNVLITPGAGNSSQVVEYMEVDYEPLEGLSYYRLKQTDFDGKFSYSNIVPVKFHGFGMGVGFNLFPNPVNQGEEVMLSFDNLIENEVLVVLRDIQGKEFYSKVILSVEESSLIAIPIDNMIPAGIYLVTASSDNQIYSQKLIVK